MWHLQGMLYLTNSILTSTQSEIYVVNDFAEFIHSDFSNSNL